MTKCAIGIGSNLGNSLSIVKKTVNILTQIPGISFLNISSYYKTKPIGPPQPDYLNLCILLEVQQSPQELLTLLQAIELQFGRVRKVRWGARTLDLDILLYGEEIINTPTLQIPHPRMNQRAFVLVPLAEIAANWLEPVSGQRVSSLVKQVDCRDVQMYLKKQ